MGISERSKDIVKYTNGKRSSLEISKIYIITIVGKQIVNNRAVILHNAVTQSQLTHAA